MCHFYLFSIYIIASLLVIITSGKNSGDNETSNALNLNSTVILQVKEGEIAFLNCFYPQFEDTTNETRNVTWMKLSNEETVLSDDALILEIENVYEFSRSESDWINLTEKYTVLHDNDNGWTLAITGINLNDTGEYQCRVDNDEGIFNQIVRVDVLKPRTVIHGARPVRVGDRLVIGCAVENAASPPEHFRWYHNENEIITDNDRLQLYPVDPLGTGGIQIHPVREDDEGVYKCAPSNSHPAESYVSVLFEDDDEAVNRVPLAFNNNLQKTTTIIALEGTAVQLPCEQDVPPESDVIWTGPDQTTLTRNEISLAGDDEFKAFAKKDNGWVLEIQVAGENSTGTYSCNVVNSSNRTSTTLVKLQVLTRTIQVLGKTKLMAGDTLKLSCYVRLVGTTKVSNIDWEHNGKLINLWQNNTEVAFVKQKYYVKSLLTIRNVQRERDEGQYVCIGSNMHIEPYVVEVKIYENNK